MMLYRVDRGIYRAKGGHIQLLGSSNRGIYRDKEGILGSGDPKIGVYRFRPPLILGYGYLKMVIWGAYSWGDARIWDLAIGWILNGGTSCRG